jgi:hypothetical protein
MTDQMVSHVCLCGHPSHYHTLPHKQWKATCIANTGEEKDCPCDKYRPMPLYLMATGVWLNEFWTRKGTHPEHDCGCGNKEECPRLHVLTKYESVEEKQEPEKLSLWVRVKRFLFDWRLSN